MGCIREGFIKVFTKNKLHLSFFCGVVKIHPTEIISSSQSDAKTNKKTNITHTRAFYYYAMTISSYLTKGAVIGRGYFS